MLKYSHHQSKVIPQLPLRKERQNGEKGCLSKNVSLCNGLPNLHLPQIVTSESQKLSLGSLHQYLNQDFTFKKQKENVIRGDKLSATKNKRKKMVEDSLIKKKTAEQILVADWASEEQKKLACRQIAQKSFQKIYGDSIARQGLNVKQKRKNILNLLNLHTLEVTISQMQFNPRSQSIMLRKEQLEMFRNDYFMTMNMPGVQYAGEDIVSIIYRLKNAYSSLKNTLIPSKNEEFDELKQRYGRKSEATPKDTPSTDIFFKTALLQSATQDDDQLFTHFLQKFKCFKNSSMIKNFASKFYVSKEEIVLQNIKEMRPPTFLCLVSSLNFEQLKILQLKYLRIEDELVFLLMDCLKELGMVAKCLKSLEISAVTIENRKKFGDKLGLCLKQLRLRTLKVEAMEIGTGQFQRIAEGLRCLTEIQEISFQNNRIDILGVRTMQAVCKTLLRLKSFDVRNNQIPHYANLTDKHSSIVFF